MGMCAYVYVYGYVCVTCMGGLGLARVTRMLFVNVALWVEFHLNGQMYVYLHLSMYMVMFLYIHVCWYFACMLACIHMYVFLHTYIYL